MDPTPAPNTPHTSPTVPRRGWWSRNWKWFVPTGCLSLIALFCIFIALIVFVVFGAMKSTDVYKTAVARAKSNPAVTAALGSPITEGMFLSGSANTSGGSGTADLSIPISGPKGKGTIYVTATKAGGDWDYSKLYVEVDKTKERIQLKESDATAGDEKN
ncbi:MAG: cytochrome c oxidase assembly factor Coa1 family protein [Chthoniobacterales bacterium]